MNPILDVVGLSKVYRRAARSGDVHAVNGVSFSVAAGETLAIVGESGSGKSTIGRCVLRLTEPSAGKVVFEGTDITDLRSSALRKLRARMQIVFQDPYASVNPRMRVGEAVEEPLRLHTTLSRAERRHAVEKLFRSVGLLPAHVNRFPHELSGGQLQRVGIARAIATQPAVVVLDEPTSSLDVSVRSGILALLQRLQTTMNTAYILISHDLTTVQGVATRVAVTYRGRFVEVGPAAEVFARPQHPYTQVLFSAALPPRPVAIAARHLTYGDPPHTGAAPVGCVFATRCPLVLHACRAAPPDFRSVSEGHSAACLRIDDHSNQLPAPASDAVA